MSAQKAEHVQRRVCVVTDCRFTGDLLCAFVESECGLHCELATGAQELPQVSNEGMGTEYLVLIDCHDRDAKTVLNMIRSVIERAPGHRLLALVDLHGGLNIEKTAISLGVRGFFYSTAAAKTLGKAVKSMFDGEMWLERRKIVEFLLQNYADALTIAAPPGEAGVSLTQREKDILSLLRQGVSNDKIAQALEISPHTVKSHLYSAFKKIEVPNRVQAALWATEHQAELGRKTESPRS